MTNTLRAWLIAALTHQDLPVIADQQLDELVDMASHEGVLVLLEYQLMQHPNIATLPTQFVTNIQQAAKHSLLHQLPFFAEQKNVFQVLYQAEIPFLVMKGAALGNWLYASASHRPITDIDLWFASQQSVISLASILQPLGFIAAESTGGLTSFERAFDKHFNGEQIRIDAHWALFNSAILASRIPFEKAYARSQDLIIQQQHVKVLSLYDALINSIGHRALKYLSHQADTLKWLYDQHLLFKALNTDQWQEFVERSAQAGISDLSLDAIEHSQAIFKTQIPQTVIEALSNNAKHEKIKRAWFQSWASYQWHEMQAVSPKLSVRLKWLGQKLWPNPEAMREGYSKNDSAWRFMLRRMAVGLKRLFGR